MSGILYGLGVGPGDPELLTLKAVRILSEAEVIAYPAPEVGDSLARAIAALHIPPGRIEIAVRTPLIPDTFPAYEVYDRYASEIAGYLEEGRDVAVLCEGDPFLYGSFMYLFERLAPRFEARVVPGVSSLGACAAAAARPLVSRNQTLAVIPAPLPEDELETRLREADAAALVKVGRHLEKVRGVLRRLGLDQTAQYVEHASMADQKVMALADKDAAPAPYFSMILVRAADGAVR